MLQTETVRIFRRCDLLRLRNRLLIPLLCFLILPVGHLFAQDAMTREDQLALAAPTVSGETGLFHVITGNTLREHDWSFGAYFEGSNLLAAPARELAPLSARPYKDYGYDLFRLSLSAGYGITDRWEVSAMMPLDRISGHGGDRVGYVNGWLYQGRFSDSGAGDLHLATKFALINGGPGSSKLALSLFTDIPTGDKNSGISSGNGNYGVGLHWTQGILTLGGQYAIVGSRDESHRNDLFLTSGALNLPNEFRVGAGLNVPINFWRTTNWISEARGTFYDGGDVKPKSPIVLSTGLRHWFGDSGWAVNGAVNWNVSHYSYDHSECAATELDDCGLSGLVGVTFAPIHIAHVAPPPPAPTPVPPPPPPPPPPAPVPPPPPPVAPPHQPTELRTDEIHFEPNSARLTNIAKAILDDVALRMKQEPTSTAIVIGYTDDRESTGPGSDLDRRRAEAVRDYLVSRHGIDPSRITVEGHDGREPAADNTSAEGRLKNRRVVIRLIIP
jgi:outer membrane protein OmpA-like peptidoglycan-associated protein